MLHSTYHYQGNAPACIGDTGDQCENVQRNQRHFNYTGRKSSDKEGVTHRWDW